MEGHRKYIFERRNPNITHPSKPPASPLTFNLSWYCRNNDISYLEKGIKISAFRLLATSQAGTDLRERPYFAAMACKNMHIERRHKVAQRRPCENGVYYRNRYSGKVISTLEESEVLDSKYAEVQELLASFCQKLVVARRPLNT